MVKVSDGRLNRVAKARNILKSKTWMGMLEVNHRNFREKTVHKKTFSETEILKVVLELNKKSRPHLSRKGSTKLRTSERPLLAQSPPFHEKVLQRTFKNASILQETDLIRARFRKSSDG